VLLFEHVMHFLAKLFDLLLGSTLQPP
jgi:hypothetical protein